MLDIREYEKARIRPPGNPVMYQRWRSLLFLHFSVNPADIQRLLPPGLTVDTYKSISGEQRAWVGLVPFRMEGVTPRSLPPIRRLHAFPETNVRTYVHREGREPGVWFFSLDAANLLACRVARRFYHLPYYESKMTVIEGTRTVQYRSKRRSDGRLCDVNCRFGDELACPEPGSLEFFLLERYILYASRKGRLATGRVHHAPYPVRSVQVDSLTENLVESARIQPHAFPHMLFSPGVDVEVFPLTSG